MDCWLRVSVGGATLEHMFEPPVDDFGEGWIPPEYEPFEDELPPWTDADELAAAQEQSPGTGLLLHLMDIDPAALSADEAVTYVEQVDRLVI